MESLSEAKLLDGKAFGAVHKLWETAERYHGRGDSAGNAGSEARTFVERAFMMRAILDELDARRLLAGNENADSRDPRALPAVDVEPEASTAAPPAAGREGSRRA